MRCQDGRAGLAPRDSSIDGKVYSSYADMAITPLPYYMHYWKRTFKAFHPFWIPLYPFFSPFNLFTVQHL